MSLSRQPAAYRDCHQLFELAVANPGGARVPVSTKASASLFQMRMNNYRVLLREQNARAYPADHHLHSTSEFDHFQVTIEVDTNDEYWVYVRPAGNWGAIMSAEPIPEDEILPYPTDHFRTPRQLAPTTPTPEEPNESTDLE